MDEYHGNGASSGPSEGRRKGPPSSSSSSKNGSSSSCSKGSGEIDGCAAPQTVPCGACKFLRRKCVSGCIFAPYFGTDQGAAKFAAVHKVFGASNASKLLLHIPVSRRQDAVMTISYEAQARLTDPVYGCASTILALQQQVAAVRTELALVQAQLMNNHYAAVPGSAQQHHHQQLHPSSHRHLNTPITMQPAYSNNSSATSNIINMGSFAPGFDVPAAASSSHNLESLHFSPRDKEEEESESRIPSAFAADFRRH
ncbi:hypothetical protein MLD38_025937 [Melastoma candidum]|uniref:Uncharacterized protein n=1 Tax=Melastoma candidum TaxID=119954 RepID=A0ACB9NYK2_9MYRT|nr:hypothetical protein MLD38_025937 [Melastoma candidum]